MGTCVGSLLQPRARRVFHSSAERIIWSMRAALPLVLAAAAAAPAAAQCAVPAGGVADGGICTATYLGVSRSTDAAGCAYVSCIGGSCACGGPIAGVVIGVLAGAALLAVAFLWMLGRYGHRLSCFAAAAKEVDRKTAAASTAASAVEG